MAPETLRDAMARATASARIDHESLAAVARRRGLGVRRQRQTLATVGALGVAGAAATVVLAVIPGAADHHQPLGTPSSATPSDSTSPTGFSPTPTAPFTGRSTAAALAYAVHQVAAGGISHIRWQDPVGAFGETYAAFRFSPAGAAGEVEVNVQPDFSGAAAGDLRRCDAWMRHCSVDRQADGDVLVTYDEISSSDQRGVRRAASLLRSDGVRVIVAASSGTAIGKPEQKISAAAPVLGFRQLKAVVAEPWWGADLPAYFKRQGARLHGKPVDGSAPTPSAGPTAGPSS